MASTTSTLPTTKAELVFDTRPSIAGLTITGSSGQLPGGCDVWRFMTSGHNTVQPVPSSRFVGPFNGHFLSCAEMFDGAFFAMGLSEVRATDPSHRLLLESAFGAIVDSELQLSATSLSVGVYLGFCNAMNWANVMAEQAAGPSVCCMCCVCVTKPAFARHSRLMDLTVRPQQAVSHICLGSKALAVA